MVKRETVEVGGLSLDLIITGPGDHPEDEAHNGEEVTISPGEVFNLTHQARTEAAFIDGLGPEDRTAYLAFKEENGSESKAESWLSSHMTAEGWLAYVDFKKYGQGGTLTHTGNGAKGGRFTEPPEGVLWG
jgi:hypothetical protein